MLDTHSCPFDVHIKRGLIVTEFLFGPQKSVPDNKDNMRW